MKLPGQMMTNFRVKVRAPSGGAAARSVCERIVEERRDGRSRAPRVHELLGGRQRLADADIHVEVAIGAEAADEAHAWRGARQDRVALEEALLLREAHRIERRVARPASAAVLAEADRPVVRLPRREVLVLG